MRIICILTFKNINLCKNSEKYRLLYFLSKINYNLQQDILILFCDYITFISFWYLRVKID